jgi:hypothetical protein
MNQHQERHHGLHHQDRSDNFTQQIDINEPAIGKTDDRESVLDELEKMMFERAR